MAAVTTSKALYRLLLRKLRVLPSEAQLHYKHRIRQVLKQWLFYYIAGLATCNLQEFCSHSTETDSQRVQQIISRALLDADWVIKKVGGSHACHMTYIRTSHTVQEMKMQQYLQ